MHSNGQARRHGHSAYSVCGVPLTEDVPLCLGTGGSGTLEQTRLIHACLSQAHLTWENVEPHNTVRSSSRQRLL